MQVDPAAWLRIGLNHGSVTKIRIFGNGDIRVFTLGESSFMPNDFVTSRKGQELLKFKNLKNYDYKIYLGDFS